MAEPTSPEQPQQPNPQQPEVNKGTFLDKLQPADRKNLTDVGQAFKETMKEMKLRGALLVVGGILSKPHPRPDIDIVLLLGDVNVAHDKKETDLIRSNRSFEITRKVISGILDKNPTFSEEYSYEPEIDPEFDSENILRNQGRIKIKPATGTPLEFVNLSMGGTVAQHFHNQREPRPFVVLKEVQ